MIYSLGGMRKYFLMDNKQQQSIRSSDRQTNPAFQAHLSGGYPAIALISDLNPNDG
jgi:hypothetical protein